MFAAERFDARYKTTRNAFKFKQTLPFTGMAQRLARGAHNSEVTRSKRVAGISHSHALQKHAVQLDVKQA
jgi:hypothetical protein